MAFLLLFIATFIINNVHCGRMWMTTDELENHISPDDLNEFFKLNETHTTTSSPTGQDEPTKGPAVPDQVDCFGLGSLTEQLPWLFNMAPDTSEKVNTHFYFTSRKQPSRVQVLPGEQFGLEWVDFNPKRRTVVIIHGFMSHSNASWVHDMTRAFLEWGDVNVIAVDWSRGGNTWKYWRAVANTRRVGSDATRFFRQLIENTGAKTRDFHFIGHSLGAHICSYLSYHLGGVARITGLDPAQPCFRTQDLSEKLDNSDADFVDVIHTNGRLLKKIGFGLPDLTGHADFYPNGGMKQPGCNTSSSSVWSRVLPVISRLEQAVCSHGRAYLLFTESLVKGNCTFRAHRWNLTYEGVNSSLVAACDRRGSCAEMGINAVGGTDNLPRAKGAYFVLTTEKEPYCPTEWERSHPRADLLRDLQNGFRLDRSIKNNTSTTTMIPYADPMMEDETNPPIVTTTTEKSIWKKVFGWVG